MVYGKNKTGSKERSEEVAKMRYVIITQQEPFFIYKVIHALLNKEEHEVVGICVLQAKREEKSRWAYLRERLRIYTLWEKYWVVWAYGMTSIMGGDISELAAVKKVPVLKTEDINSDAFVAEVRKLRPDAIVSISPPQLFQRPLLDSAQYCINLHASLLPRHRGVFGTWWTLFEGDEVGGITVHEMVEKIDAGSILYQDTVPITSDETQFSLAWKTKRLMPKAIIHCLSQLSNGPMPVLAPNWETSYNYAPTKKEAREFRKSGHRIFRMRDLKCMISRQF